MSSTMTLTAEGSVCQPVPPFTSHAISMSLPTWQDNVAYELGEKRIIDKITSAYPRFFIHKHIQKLASICERKFGRPDERCLLCPSKQTAAFCREFMTNKSPNASSPISVRVIEFCICPEDTLSSAPSSSSDTSCYTLHIVLFPAEHLSLAKQFWQHTGMGISSRVADWCLSNISESPGLPLPLRATTPAMAHTLGPRLPSSARNRHYAVKSPALDANEESATKDMNVYLEERYGRNMPIGYAAAAKRALRRRIAGVLVHNHALPSPTLSPLQHQSHSQQDTSHPSAGRDDTELGPSTRGVEGVTEDDVFLFPTGMTAIWWAHHLALLTLPETKSVCFGFPYTDTLKILQKWGPGCYHFGFGTDDDIDKLEKLLEELSPNHGPGSKPPILALFTEFPSNPLLRSPNLQRLRAVADRYDFLIVVDETVGNFVNVSVLPYSDIVVSSLTKVFSGDSNVMGGSMILNPRARHYAALKSCLLSVYEDFYFNEDAIFMERNSRDFRKRVHVINANAEAVCSLLQSSKAAIPSLVKEIYYPKYTSRENYEACRAADLPPSVDAFGGLFSVTFHNPKAAHAFFDHLGCYKGPSLGTNFTLACPYVVLAHFAELEWARGFGVDEGLVRVSVGIEERDTLLRIFEDALRVAQEASELADTTLA